MSAAISSGVSIPLNDRAVEVSKRMARATSGTDEYSLENVISRGKRESISKAAETINKNKHVQQVVDQQALGASASPTLDVKA